MRSRAVVAVTCAALAVAAAFPAAAEAEVDPSPRQTTSEDTIAADLAARVAAAESEFSAANARWQSADRASFGADRAAKEAEHGADEATRTAGVVAAQAYRGGMVDQVAPLLAIIDPEAPDQDLRAVESFTRIASHVGQEAITKQGRAATLDKDAHMARKRLSALTVAFNDARARLAAVRAEVAGAQLRKDSTAASPDPTNAERNETARAAWQRLRQQSKAARVPTFTADQLRSGHLPRGVVRVKGAPGVARFKVGKRWLPAIPNETVEAISYNIGALGTNYFWQSDMGTDCVRITGGAWKQEGTDLSGLAGGLPLRTAKSVHAGDQVFLASDAHGLYQTGIALDGTHMIAADANTWAVNVVTIKNDDVWRVARPGAAGTASSQIPQGSDQWQCGADPLGQLGQLRGTPQQIIEQSVLPWAMHHGFPDVTPAHVLAANARHGPTVSGGRSDHQGPGDLAWAADISNGGSPTPEMDQLAQTLAKAYGLPWTGSGVVQVEKDGYRIQMLYRTNVGGNHFNHVHIGIRRTDPTPAPPGF